MLLLGFLALAAWLVLKKRSRTWIAGLGVLAVFWFGFWREGCVCPIGAVQNVALAVFQPGYPLPLTVAVFFFLPLVFALFFGRVFCAAVCPFGALQDLVLIRPIQLPRWVDQSLGLLAYVYLGLGVLLAATGAQFIICKYDPFVGFFRLHGPYHMLLLGLAFLVAGVWIGRPYCRWLCPYGVLLRWLSRFSKWNVRIAPQECINCRLCEKSCPVNAIHSPIDPPAPADLGRARRRLGLALAAAPALVAAGILLGGRVGPALAPLHPALALAEEVHHAQAARDQGGDDLVSDAVTAFRKSQQTPEALYARAAAVYGQFRLGGGVLGAFVGLVFAGRLVRLSRHPRRGAYEADRAACVGCGRCFDYCPKELERRGVPLPVLNPEPATPP